MESFHIFGVWRELAHLAHMRCAAAILFTSAACTVSSYGPVPTSDESYTFLCYV